VYKTKTKTSIYVLEEPRDQDQKNGLEDYNTSEFNCSLSDRIPLETTRMYLEIRIPA